MSSYDVFLVRSGDGYQVHSGGIGHWRLNPDLGITNISGSCFLHGCDKSAFVHVYTCMYIHLYLYLYLSIYIYIYTYTLFEGSLEAKLPTIWRDENGTARKKLGRGESQQG